MKVELIRNEIQRLIKQNPFRKFVLSFVGGEQAVLEHPENVAFDPRPGSTSDFYVLTGSLRLFSTFDAVSSVTICLEINRFQCRMADWTNPTLETP